MAKHGSPRQSDIKSEHEGQHAVSYIPTAGYGQRAGGLGHHGGERRRAGGANNSHKRRSGRSGVAGAVIALIAVAALVGGGALFWFNHPINVSLNGKTVSVPQRASIAQVMEAADVSVASGNLVAVDGSSLSEHEGWSFSATVNGEEMGDEEGDDYQVSEGDKIEVADGHDKTEPYDFEAATLEPKLTNEGSNGTITYVSQWGKPGRAETRTGKTSGITATVTVEEPQDCVITYYTPRPDNGEKLVALTFDDGPGEFTEAFLDVLKKNDVKATFFCVGRELAAEPELAKKVAEGGHQVCSHTNTHPEMTTLDATDVHDELSTSFATLESTTGVRSTTFRPPYGAFWLKTWLKSGGVASVAVTWTQDSLDWTNPGADQIVANSLSGVSSGSIILMHDGGFHREQGLEALPKIIQSLKSKGYRFVTISELMKSDSSIPAEIAECDATMPEDCVWPTEIAE